MAKTGGRGMGDLPKCGGDKLVEVTNRFAEKWGLMVKTGGWGLAV